MAYGLLVITAIYLSIVRKNSKALSYALEYTDMVVHTGVCDLKTISKDSCVTIIHGGAGPADPKDNHAKAAEQSIRSVLESLSINNLELSFEHDQKDQPLTQAEQSALQAVKLLEDDPIFNAGYGAALQIDGAARVSASFMESTRDKFSSVYNVEGIRHPSELAYYLQSQKFCMLDPRGAADLAHFLNIPPENLVTKERHRKWLAAKKLGSEAELGNGTVGAVSTTRTGQMAAITSTGGVSHETVGRVGDTPTVAGNYCRERVGLSCTGIGEHIVNEAFSAKTATRVLDGMPLVQAVTKGLKEAESNHCRFAVIALEFDKKKQCLTWAAGSTAAYFVWGLKLPDKSVKFTDYL